MPRLLLAAALLAVVPTSARAQDDDEFVKVRRGKFVIEEYSNYTRLIYDGTLIGSQVKQRTLHKADVPNYLGLGTQSEALALLGAHTRWNPRLEPLTYYHRSGPVGAMFYHLRTRKGGADVAAPVGVCGLYAGTPAAYALRGQSMTFYSVHDEPRELIDDTDEYFRYIPDARRRGAKIDVQYGPLRETLAADADKRFALLLVEMVEEGFDPRDRLTLEAVKLYMDRTRPDGIVALHLSNKRFNLEPVLERIARELKLSGRAWPDDAGTFPGKTASTWAVLARSESDLGPLAKPVVEQITTFGTRNEALVRLYEKYGPDTDALAVILTEWGGPVEEQSKLTPRLMSIRHGPQVGVLHDSAIRLRAAGRTGPYATLGALAQYIYGSMFHPLIADPRVDLRTDAHRPSLPALPVMPEPPKK
jgi:hypothetical protein